MKAESPTSLEYARPATRGVSKLALFVFIASVGAVTLLATEIILVRNFKGISATIPNMMGLGSIVLAIGGLAMGVIAWNRRREGAWENAGLLLVLMYWAFAAILAFNYQLANRIYGIKVEIYVPTIHPKPP